MCNPPASAASLVAAVEPVTTGSTLTAAETIEPAPVGEVIVAVNESFAATPVPSESLTTTLIVATAVVVAAVADAITATSAVVTAPAASDEVVSPLIRYEVELAAETTVD